MLEELGSDAYVFFAVDARAGRDRGRDDGRAGGRDDAPRRRDASARSSPRASTRGRTRASASTIRLAVDPSRLYFFSPETGESLLNGAAALAGFVDPHTSTTRARRLRADVGAAARARSTRETRPRRRAARRRPRVDRISLGRGAARSSTGRPSSASASGRSGRRTGSAVRATVPEEWRGARVDLLWDSNSEATLWLDGAPCAGPEPAPRATPCSSSDAAPAASARVRGRARVQRPLRRSRTPPVELHALRARASSTPTRGGSTSTSRRCARSRPHEATRPELGRRAARPSSTASATRGRDATRARSSRSCYERRNGTRDARARGDRPRAHRHGVALAARRDLPQDACARSARRCGYMDEYPEYRFACSQAQQYAWIEEREPGSLGAHPREGRRAGSSCPSAAAGSSPTATSRRASRSCGSSCTASASSSSEFGRALHASSGAPTRSATTASCRRSCARPGITRFLTQKLSWNRFNQPEHHTFVWQGIDGSEVLAHFPPADTYTQRRRRSPELLRTAREYQDHEHSRTSLLVFGHGDGGGGPTRDDARDAARARATCRACRARGTRRRDEFFDALEAEPRRAAGRRRRALLRVPPRHVHDAGARRSAATGAASRRCTTPSSSSVARGGDYPRAELDRLWKLLLLQQFHDILPGSSIRLVYEDAERDLAEVEAGAEAICAARGVDAR